MIVSIAISKLVASNRNVRRVVDETADLQLKADIKARGLLQNLVVISVPKPKGCYAVVAGERRRRGLAALVVDGDLPKTHEVNCFVVDELDADEASLAENFQRLAMNPVDECLAFQQLIEQGADTEGVARRFGLTVRFVEGRIRLAGLAPIVFEALGRGDITLDVAKAYAMTADQERQAHVFEQLSRGWNEHHPASIRRMLQHETVRGTDRRARFVGEEDYVAAGGRIERDLFSDGTDERWLDIAILDRLASEKLDARAAEACSEQGLGFVRPSFSRWLNGSDLVGLERLVIEPLPLTEQEQQQVEAMAEEIDDLIAVLEQDDTDDVARIEAERKIASLEASIEALKSRLPDLDSDLRAAAGAFLILDETGTPRLGRNLYVPVKDQEQEHGESDDPDAAGPAAPGNTDGSSLSQRLIEELAMQRRDILAAHVEADPAFARDLAAFLMVDRHARQYLDDAGSSLSASPPTDPVVDFRTPEARATLAADAARDALDRSWLDVKPQGARFDAFRSLSEDARAAWLANAVARTLKASVNVAGGRACAFHDHLGHLLGIDVASWWRPTGATYFDRVPKSVVLLALREVGGDALAARYAKAKKAELADAAERVFAGEGIFEAEVRTAALAWLPEAMRFKASTASASDDLDPPFDVDEPVVDPIRSCSDGAGLTDPGAASCLPTDAAEGMAAGEDEDEVVIDIAA